jgi:hypothetical protein
MKVGSGQWTDSLGWRFDNEAPFETAQLVLYFAAPGTLDDGERLAELHRRHPAAKLVGCTSGGEILGSEVYDGTIVAVALKFDHARIELRSRRLSECQGSLDAGCRLGADLPKDDLRAVFVLSDGTLVNGSDLVRGLRETLPADVVLTGGLAGDGAEFKSTLVGADCPPETGLIAAIGFYGASVDVRHGSYGGWDAFGPDRVITRSDGNVLYELDGEPALDLYKRYLGDEAARLPGSALLFPLKVRRDGNRGTELVRTVVGIDEANKAMIFAGDVPAGSSVQLMRGNFDHLIEGAGQAAQQTGGTMSGGLAILVSCIGRKLLLGQQVVDEVEAVAEILGPDCTAIGLYSYGEISPHEFTGSCDLHNQTMTITVIGES